MLKRKENKASKDDILLALFKYNFSLGDIYIDKESYVLPTDQEIKVALLGFRPPEYIKDLSDCSDVALLCESHLSGKRWPIGRARIQIEKEAKHVVLLYVNDRQEVMMIDQFSKEVKPFPDTTIFLLWMS